MSVLLEKIKSLGYEFNTQQSALANYLPVVQAGNMVYTSGHLPLKNGDLIYKGEVGGIYLTIEEGQQCAKQCVINALASINSHIGDLGRIKKIVKLTGFVKTAKYFSEQHLIMNGASDFLVEIFGKDIGSHARSAVGVVDLPLDAPVEIEMIVELF